MVNKIGPIILGVFILLIFYTTNCLAKTISVSSGQSIQNAISSASGGDIIQVSSGTFNERINITKSVTVKCSTNHACIIKGAVLSGNAILDGFYSLNSDTNDGAIVMNGSGNIARNNKVEGSCMVGIKLDGSGNLAENNEVLKSRQCSGSSAPDADGFRYFGSNQIMRGNYIHDIFFDNSVNLTPHIDCFQTWGGASGAIIENNICDNFSAHVGSTESTQGANLENDNGATFNHNYFHTHGKKIMIETSSSNTIITNNIFVGGAIIPNAPTQYGIFGSGTNITAKNNIFYNINVNNGTSLLLGVTNSSGNLLNTDPKLDTNWRPIADSPACLAGGAYIGAYACGNTASPKINTKIGDLNGDNRVDVVDLGILIDSYGKGVSLYPKSDVNGDGVININDIGVVIDNYGK